MLTERDRAGALPTHKYVNHVAFLPPTLLGRKREGQKDPVSPDVHRGIRSTIASPAFPANTGDH